MIVTIIIDATKHNERRNGEKTPNYWSIEEVIPDSAKRIEAGVYKYIDGLIRYSISTHWWEKNIIDNMLIHILYILKNGSKKGGRFIIEIDSKDIKSYGRINFEDIINIKPLKSIKKKTYSIIE